MMVLVVKTFLKNLMHCNFIVFVVVINEILDMRGKTIFHTHNYFIVYFKTLILVYTSIIVAIEVTTEIVHCNPFINTFHMIICW